MIILGIETSCDETGIALYSPERGVIAQSLHSQIDLHAQYGGVVPELASRDHIRFLAPLLKKTLAEARLQKADAVAYTAGPGLAGALLTGAAFARSLAWSWQVPAIKVHHMEAHLLVPMLHEPIELPFIALLVSGGHTLLVKVNAISDYQILGQSLDDAVGEAFDKTAKMMGLSYPGGPAIAAQADRVQNSRFELTRPMLDRPDLNFSFSGLKTHVLTLFKKEIKNNPDQEQLRAEIAWAFQEAVVDILVNKCQKALHQTDLSRLVLAGGVAANRRLRQRIKPMIESIGGQLFYPPVELCTDNGAMIAYAGYHHLQSGCSDDLDFSIRPRWPIEQLRSG